MTDKILYWATVIFATLALMLFITNTALIDGNQKIQSELNQRQNVINIATNYAGPGVQQLSRALFEASVKNGDMKLRELLTSQGIKLPDVTAKGEAPKAEQPKAEKPAAKAAPAPKAPHKDEE